MGILTIEPFPTLTTNRLVLRKATLKDAADYHKILSCPETSQYSDVPHQPTVKRSERFVSYMSKLHPRKTGVGWIITSREDQSILGGIRINSIEKKTKCGVIGYELHPDHWNKGYATDALHTVVDYAHNVLALNRLEAWANEENVASEKVLLKNGFQHEGTQRDKVWFRDQFWTVRLYGRLASDEVPNR